MVQTRDQYLFLHSAVAALAGHNAAPRLGTIDLNVASEVWTGCAAFGNKIVYFTDITNNITTLLYYLYVLMESHNCYVSAVCVFASDYGSV